MWISKVKTEAWIDDHCNPEGNENDKEPQIPAFPVMSYDLSSTSTAITTLTIHLQVTVYTTARVPPDYRPQRSSHESHLSLCETQESKQHRKKHFFFL